MTNQDKMKHLMEEADGLTIQAMRQIGAVMQYIAEDVGQATLYNDEKAAIATALAKCGDTIAHLRQSVTVPMYGYACASSWDIGNDRKEATL